MDFGNTRSGKSFAASYFIEKAEKDGTPIVTNNKDTTSIVNSKPNNDGAKK